MCCTFTQSLLYCAYMYTLLGGCEEWRADVARNYYTNREQILDKGIQGYWHCWKYDEMSCSLFCLLQDVSKSAVIPCAVPCTMYISKENQFQVACMPGMMVMMTHIVEGYRLYGYLILTDFLEKLHYYY